MRKSKVKMSNERDLISSWKIKCLSLKHNNSAQDSLELPASKIWGLARKSLCCIKWIFALTLWFFLYKMFEWNTKYNEFISWSPIVSFMLLKRTQALSSIHRKYPLEISGTHFLTLTIHPHKIPADCTIPSHSASQYFTQLSTEMSLVPHPSHTAQKAFHPLNCNINCVITKRE